MRQLTKRQREVIDYIREHLARHGMPPTQAEIGRHFRFTQKAAGDHLRLISQKGYVEVLPETPRGLRLLPRAEALAPTTKLPLFGRVAAGNPLESGEDVEELLPISPEMFRPRADYLRRIVGDSMIDMGIRDRDLIGVRTQSTAVNGQVVVAKLFRGPEPEITVKTFFRKGSMVELRPSNPQFALFRIDLKKEPIELEGLYCGHVHIP